jgi:hypothetical protein
MVTGAALAGRGVVDPRDTRLQPFPEPEWGGAPAGRTLAPAQPLWHRRHEYEARVYVEGVPLVVYEVEWNGAHPCPLRTLNQPDRETLEELESRAHPHYHGYRHGGRDWVITNEMSGESIFVPSLTAHLITDHGYFQCSGRYRVDPTTLMRVLGLLSAPSPSSLRPPVSLTTFASPSPPPSSVSFAPTPSPPLGATTTIQSEPKAVISNTTALTAAL